MRKIFLVACYVTLHPTLSVCRMVGWSITYYFFNIFAVFGLTASALMTSYTASSHMQATGVAVYPALLFPFLVPSTLSQTCLCLCDGRSLGQSVGHAVGHRLTILASLPVSGWCGEAVSACVCQENCFICLNSLYSNYSYSLRVSALVKYGGSGSAHICG